MSAEHTPTPWYVRSGQMSRVVAALAGEDKGYVVYVSNCRTDGWRTKERKAEDHANAAHIVKCVNEYDTLRTRNEELVKMLEACESALYRSHDFALIAEEYPDDTILAVWRQTVTLIAKEKETAG